MADRDRRIPADTTEDESRTDISGFNRTLPSSRSPEASSGTLTDPGTNPILTRTFFGPGTSTATEPGADRTPIIAGPAEDLPPLPPRRTDRLLRIVFALGALIAIGLGAAVLVRLRAAPSVTPLFGAISPDEWNLASIGPIGSPSRDAAYRLPSPEPVAAPTPAPAPAPAPAKRPPRRDRPEPRPAPAPPAP